jgi:hypothetical protein
MSQAQTSAPVFDVEGADHARRLGQLLVVGHPAADDDPVAATVGCEVGM